MKRCPKCGEEKAYSEFHKNKREKDGLQSYCKVCHKASQKAYREANREKMLAYYKAYHKANREKRLAYNKAYREANREELLAYNKAYREANREKMSAYMKAYLKAYYEANPEKFRDYSQKRRARKRNLPAEDVRLSVLRERDGDTCYLCGRVINFDWPYKFPNGRLNPDYPNIDHVIPLARGGSHTYDNTKLAHAICNLRKKDKILEEEETQ